MNSVISIINRAQDAMDWASKNLDFIGPLLLRLYLVPVFWVAGRNKWDPLDPDSTLEPVIQWFGNPDWGLGLPFPAVLAFLAWAAEYIGAVLLALGLAVRWICLPLILTMVVAAVTVHWDNGWQAVHDPLSPFPSANIDGAMDRLDMAKSILQEYGHYDWLTETGNFVISNNGMEWAATYFVMAVALFFLGGGRYVSVDYWIARRFRKTD